ncbi:hypothetical protein HO133_004598 [Letharia lupina]|uniref:Methyltransferase type 11 domain-containing protein n=1 Tax=Letharia lupina TaxID=560253 RepID=A0A8H6FKL1_9LECA|nr:uncharacterized protein HO133_004598 [Letharia lupina]KAF6230258.1 hypothetical protein HO133_004598 [Letharia lupina]
MASRGAFGFKSAKQSGKAESKEKTPVGPSPRPPIASSASNSSKMPTHSSSFFSRSKHIRPKVDSSSSNIATASNTSTNKSQSSLRVATTRSEPGTRTIAEPARNAGLGISTLTQSPGIPAPKSGKQVRNILRRKAPIEQHGQYARTDSSASSYEPTPSANPLQTVSSPGGYRDAFPGSVFGIAVPAVSSTPALGQSSELATSSSRMASYNTRNTPEALSTQNLPPPTPTFADSGSSTRRSESPGAFSRTSTPTSMSSQSPGVSTPIKAPIGRKQLSPTRSRPPVTRRKFPGVPLQEDSNISRSRGLTAVRESLTSSSSSSTVKGTDRRDGSQVHSTSNRSTPIPPSPPVRQSSMRLGPSPLKDHGRRREVIKGAPDLRSYDAVGLQRPHGESFVAQNDSYRHNWSRTPPPRPSREGTPSLDLNDTLDLLQGTKTRIILDRDVPSSERAVGTNTSRTALGRFPSNASSMSARPSRMPSPNPVVTNPLRPIRSEPSKPQALPLVETNVGGVRSTKDPSPLSASSSKSSSRFGFFMKRTRSPLDTAAFENPEKAAKKGPAAGTGHEGYGKYARRGRSGSISTSASRGRSTSTNSAGRTSISRKSSFTSRDDHEMDEFLRERLAPVVMTGGGQAIDGRTLASVHHPTSSGESAAAMTSSESLDGTGEPLSRQMLMRSETPGRELANMHYLRRDHRRLPDRKDNPEYRIKQQEEGYVGSSYGEPTLAARRSAHRSQLFGKAVEVMKIPAPIDTRAVAASPSMESHDDLQSILIRTDGTLQFNDNIIERREGNWLKSQNPEGRARSRSPRKWAFFQRAQASPRTRVEAIAPQSSNDQTSFRELPATVSSLPESRSVAFYALLDGSEQEVSNEMGVIQSAERNRLNTIHSGVPASLSAQDISPQRDHRLSTLLPSPPRLTAESPNLRVPLTPSAILRPPEATTAAAREVRPVPLQEPKKPRLQQVGRIPRVVSKRDRPHKPPPQSFSRPFARRPSIVNEAPTTVPEIGAQNHVERPRLGILTEVIPSNTWGDQDSAKPASAPVKPSEGFYGIDKDEFLAFPPRIGSEVSGSSSSGILSLVGTTAIVPEPGTAPDEDEVWNEYNEFLDTVESPAPLAEESKNPLETILRKGGWAPEPLHIRKVSSGTGSSSSIEKRVPATYPGISAPTRPLPSPPDRSKLSGSGRPATPVTISDLLAGYGDQNRSSAINRRRSLSSGSRYSTSSIESDPNSLGGRENRQKKTSTPPVSAKTHTGPIVQSSLRFDALMTSRWLSFDRVLFSPALVEAKRNHKGRVLVLDGLGNDDWSFYCAETYVDVDIFNLSPKPASSPQIGALQLPKNYHQVQHVDIKTPFPFETGSFTAAVFRFPAATSEDAYLNSISECMRVLRPGGYLEMSILDIDMVNMGNRARRTLDELKYRMAVSQPELDLRPLSDSLQKMVKQSGFENLNRCVLNVPVAGHVSRSRSRPGSLDENSGTLKDLRKEPSGQGDGGLAKSLAIVGRWWFTRCYEMITLPYGGLERSMWNDEALLQECEKRGTGFKLLLCYAQKPVDPKSQPGSTSKTTRGVRVRP